MKYICGALLASLSCVFGNNDRPIIGILSQEVSSTLNEFNITGTYIASSYVKWVEAAGARAVPIIVNSNQDFEQLFEYINGLLIPGGAVSLDQSPYSRVGNMMLEKAMKSNDAGEYFPVWGTCLGFELLAFLTNNEVPNLKRCEANGIGLPLNPTEDFVNSRVLKEADSEMLVTLSTEDVTSNFHHWCLTMQNFTKYDMGEFWNVISTNEDMNGMEFISMIEAKDYPVYGVQFHPEKNNYEWAPKLPSIPHSRGAVKISNYFADFFVEESRKSTHQFPSRKVEEEYLIYNWNPIYTGQENINYGFQTIYVFPNNV